MLSVNVVARVLLLRFFPFRILPKNSALIRMTTTAVGTRNTGTVAFGMGCWTKWHQEQNFRGCCRQMKSRVANYTVLKDGQRLIKLTSCPEFIITSKNVSIGLVCVWPGWNPMWVALRNKTLYYARPGLDCLLEWLKDGLDLLVLAQQASWACHQL